MIRYLSLSVAVSLLVGSLQAQTSFSDDFDRADSTDVGSAWTEVTGDWEIFNNVVRSVQEDLTTEKMLVHEAVTLDRGFIVEADFNWTPVRSQWNGIIWHVNGADNYYLLRVRADRGQVQALKRVNGGSSEVLFDSGRDAVPIATDVFHRVSVSGDGTGNFSWSVAVDGETIGSGIFSEETPLPNGAAGVYGGREAVEVDNFFLETFDVQVEPPVVTIGTAVEVYFKTTLGGFYQIESSPDLVEWFPEGELIAGDGTEVSQLFSTRNTDRKFFRVLTTTE